MRKVLTKTIYWGLLAVVFIGCFLLPYSCVEIDKENMGEKNERSSTDEVNYGGTLHIPLDERFSDLFPMDVIDASSFKIVTQMHDGLLDYDPKDLSLRGAVADKWEVDSTNTVYTFYLNENIRFHDDACFSGGEGRKLVADDVKFSFELLCSKDFKFSYDILMKPYLEGAESFYNGTQTEISGIKIIDSHTIQLTINNPSSSFLYMLAMPNTSIIAHEAYNKYGKDMTVGNGPFRYVGTEDNQKELFLVVNDNYYLSDENNHSLPFLDSLHFVFNLSKLEQLEKFDIKDLSIIQGLPSSKIVEVVDKDIEQFKKIPPDKILERPADLASEYYEFVTTKKPFDDVRVRKAFNYAIDRTKLLNNVLNGQGVAGLYGITPRVPIFDEVYDFSQVGGYDFNPELAKTLMSEAGYPEGKDFPNVTLEINLGGNLHRLVSDEIQQQLKQTLGVNIDIEQVSFKDKIEHSKYGQSEMYRSAWGADYPSPESFLSIFYGANVPNELDAPSYPNTMRYQNPVFDSLFVLGKTTTEDTERLDLFAKAEKVMMDDAPIMVLWYRENYTLYHSFVRNFHDAGPAIADFSSVFLKEMTVEEITDKTQ